ncbi:MAG: DNA polymerase III subunit delta' [Gammaproteobacteria bacterium]|nr:DNA polymerase III subunit delta' [Gammaproteobacteria bacterium]
MTDAPPWLTQAWQNLLKRQTQHALPHALLITGNKGIGKLSLARAFSKRLLCKMKKACGHCHACTLFDCGHHADFFYVAPQEHGQIKIDQIRQLTEALSQTAQQGGYRVVIIQEAHTLNTAAGNALLKTLEEPGAQTLLMLLTDSAAWLSATLRSRCQLLTLRTEKIAALAWLMEQGLSQERAQYFFEASEAAPLLALTLSQSDYLLEREAMINTLSQVVKGELSVVAAASVCLEKPLDDTLNLFQLIVMDLIRVKTDLPVFENKSLPLLSEHFSLAHLFSCYDKACLFRQHIKSHLNLNATLLLENLFLAVS